MAYTTLEMVQTYSTSFASLMVTPPSHRATTPDRPDPHFAGAILLRPARRSGARLVLCPLLPPPNPKTDLPAETWARCLRFAMDLTYEHARVSPHEFSRLIRCRRDVLLVNKSFKNIASPILYSHIKLGTLRSLESLHNVLQSADQKWDSLRRIPFSTPGRWIQCIDISSISDSLPNRAAKLDADTLLSGLFRLTPFLTILHLDPKLVLSGRAMSAILEGCGPRLRVLKGIAAGPDFGSIPPSQWLVSRDPLSGLVRACRNLEVLEVYGPGMVSDEDTLLRIQETHDLTFQSIPLARLHTLTLSGVPQSPLFYSLIHSPLPSLSRLTFTVYPSRSVPSPSASFLASHGKSIESLILTTPPDWPPPDFASYDIPQSAYLSESILHILPRLIRLNLSFPLPPLVLLPNEKSPLRTLLFPRPIPALLPFVLDMVGSRESSLKTVVWTRAKWLRSDVGQTSRVARSAGDQLEMRRWRRLLAGKVRIIDADGREV